MITEILLGLWLLLIPTQLGRHWWPEWSYVNGIRVDYLAPVWYLVDVVWLGWVITKLPKLLKILKSERKWGVLGLGLVVVNVLVATNKWAAIYKAGRWVQLIVTMKLIKNCKLRITNYLKWVIPAWVVVESLLGWGQIIRGGSLEGIWYWLGERRFSYLTIGVANWEVWGRGLVRAYGTFSHPNSLAGFLLVSLIIWTKLKKRGIFYWIVVWIGILGIVVSGSRVVWGLTLGFMIYDLRFMNKKKLLGFGLVIIGVITMILAGINKNYRVSDFVGGWDRAGWSKRISLDIAAIKMIKDKPLLGVGLNNFLVKLPEYQGGGQYWLQPVHNVILLWVAETGILGLGLVILMIRRFMIYDLRFMNKTIWGVLGVILVTGMVDHYWLTLPQNMWLLTIVASLSGLSSSSSKIGSVKKTDS